MASSNLCPMEKFNCDIDIGSIGSGWIKWRRAYELFIITSNIVEPKKKLATLLHCGGIKLQEIFYSIHGVEDLQNEEMNVYDIAIQKLNEYFTPKKSVMYERNLFRNIKQEGEKFNNFLLLD